MIGKSLIAGLVLCLFTCVAHAAVIHVDVDAAGANDGSDWANAFVDLQSALAAAQAGDTVRVAQGTYAPAGPGGSRHAAFGIPDGVRLVGGFAGDGEVDPDAFDPQSFVTILTGDLSGDDGPDFANDTENAYHVVTARDTHGGTLLRGCTITGGRADDSDLDAIGGGVMCANGVLIIRECIIETNRAYQRGGGVAASGFPNSSRVRMSDCIIRGNTLLAPVGAGGGASAGYGSTFTDCVFADNVVPVAGSGGGLSGTFVVIDGCEFIDNVASEDGGALVGSQLTILNSTFRGNRSSIWGGAALITGKSEIRNCLFEDNQSDLGGAIRFQSSSDPDATHDILECAFIDNQANVGGALSINSSAPVHLVNSDFLGNIADSDFFSGGPGGAVNSNAPLVAVNSLFAGNSSTVGGAAISASGPATIVNCTIVGNQSNTSLGTIRGGAIVVDGKLNLHNCILWDNSSASLTVETEQVSGEDDAVFRIRNCIIQGWTGDFGGSQNSGGDPMFVDGDGGDDTYGTLDDDPRLGVGSPARNSGRNDLLPRDDFDLDGDGNLNERIAEDLDGDRRIRQGTADRGAFETLP